MPLPFSARFGRSLRVCALIGSAFFAVAFVAPGAIEMVAGSDSLGRQPELSLRVARMACAAAASMFAMIALAGPALERAALALYRGWSALSARRFVWWVAGLATAERLLVALLPTRPAPGDMLWYHETAVALARGAGLSVDGVLTAYRPPGYSFLLSLTYALGGPHAQLAWVWGTLATALLLFSAHGAAGLLYGPLVARFTTLGLAVYPAFALLTGQTMSDLVFSAALTALVHHVLAGRARGAPALFVTGVALGLVALIRSVGIIAAVPILFVALADRGTKTAAMTACPLLLGLALPLGCWAARNHAVFGLFALDTNTGFNLLVGNHPGASGGYTMDEALRLFAPPGHALNEVALDRVYAARAIAFIRSNPGEWMLSWPRKLVHLFALELSAPRGALPENTPWLALKYGLYTLCQLSYAAVFGLFCARLLSFVDREQRPRRRQWVGLLVGAAVASVAVVTFGMDRYRLPFTPWMMIEAAVAYCGFCGPRSETWPGPA